MGRGCHRRRSSRPFHHHDGRLATPVGHSPTSVWSTVQCHQALGRPLSADICTGRTDRWRSRHRYLRMPRWTLILPRCCCPCRSCRWRACGADRGEQRCAADRAGTVGLDRGCLRLGTEPPPWSELPAAATRRCNTARGRCGQHCRYRDAAGGVYAGQTHRRGGQLVRRGPRIADWMYPETLAVECGWNYGHGERGEQHRRVTKLQSNLPIIGSRYFVPPP